MLSSARLRLKSATSAGGQAGLTRSIVAVQWRGITLPGYMCATCGAQFALTQETALAARWFPRRSSGRCTCLDAARSLAAEGDFFGDLPQARCPRFCVFLATHLCDYPGKIARQEARCSGFGRETSEKWTASAQPEVAKQVQREGKRGCPFGGGREGSAN